MVIQRNWQSLIKPEKLDVEPGADPHRVATVVAEPLERGFGMTLGNAVRRVLLSSLQGAAVTAVQIVGVLHEFSSIPGVREDVTDIVLNVKQLALRMHGEGPKRMSLVATGPAEVTAGQIQTGSDIDVMNPGLVICTLDDGIKLDMEFTVNLGKGYVPAASNRPEDAPIGLIPIDAIYTPIKNVSYKIENTRVGQKTDFEKLTIELKTDGTIHPEEAIKEASRIMIQHLILITDENITFNDEKAREETVVDEHVLHMRKLLKTSLEDLDLSVRAYNCLKAAKINSLSELVRYDTHELLKFRNFGRKSLVEIEDLLHEKGLSFGMDLSKFKLEED